MVLDMIGGDLLTYVIVPLLIFIARVVDVSMGTIRVLFIAKGFKYWAPLIGFFEVIVWLLAISTIMENLTNVYAYIAYGAGFAAGTYLGIILESKFVTEKVVFRIFLHDKKEKISEILKEKYHHLTKFDGYGSDGKKILLIFLTIDRKEIPFVKKVIKEHVPDAYYTVGPIKFSRDDDEKIAKSIINRFGFVRKGK